MVRGIVATRTIFWYYGGWEGSLAPVSVIDISMQCMLKDLTDLLAKKCVQCSIASDCRVLDGR
jgi:hypothetical protein